MKLHDLQRGKLSDPNSGLAMCIKLKCKKIDTGECSAKRSCSLMKKIIKGQNKARVDYKRKVMEEVKRRKNNESKSN